MSTFSLQATVSRMGRRCKFRQFFHETALASRFFFPKMRRKRRKCRRFEELCHKILRNCRRIEKNCRENFGFCGRIHRKCRRIRRKHGSLRKHRHTSRKATPTFGLPDRPPPPRFPHLLHTPINNTAGLAPNRNWFLAHFQHFCAIFSINLYAPLHYSLRQYTRTVCPIGYIPSQTPFPHGHSPKLYSLHPAGTHKTLE